ncbi:uracil phosphoribosyltransferase [Compostibacter hankyongensis]|uniref:Uracil phosphoribosyltransferase n=1 Tax=Compostibacter hankyongensis TaxID=1007089 RepID=A0ABP8FID7_9BACT
MVINLSATPSLAGVWVGEIRDKQLQTDRMRFRRNLERIGEAAAYEISKHLSYRQTTVTTPLGTATCAVPEQQPVLATILRAGMPLHQGLLHYFDRADNAFISAYRKHHADGSFDIQLDYLSCPPLDGRVLILADPMLATGASLVKTLQCLLKEGGQPAAIHVVSALASTEGIRRVQEAFPKITLWAGDIDEQLNDKGYIVPGLGDAGDLAFGLKKQQ